jgi:hypothetical protein
MSNAYISLSSPTSAFVDLGPGVPSSTPTNPLGSGIQCSQGSNAAAQIELRVAQSGLTTRNILVALDNLARFIRQRGYIGGSGGPVGGASFSDAAQTATTTSGSPVLTAVTSTLNWRVGYGITGAGIPAGSTILGISASGTVVLISANATATATLVALTVSGASVNPSETPV